MPFGVDRLIEALAHQTPLDGHVATAAVDRNALVDAPTHRTVIDDDAFAFPAAKRVQLDIGRISRANSQIADDDVVRPRKGESIVLQADAIAGCRLTGDRDVAVLQLEVRLEGDVAGNAKDHRAGSFLIQRCPQAAGTGVVQVRHGNYAPAAAARGDRTEAFRSGECRDGRGGRRGSVPIRGVVRGGGAGLLGRDNTGGREGQRNDQQSSGAIHVGILREETSGVNRDEHAVAARG